MRLNSLRLLVCATILALLLAACTAPAATRQAAVAAPTPVPTATPVSSSQAFSDVEIATLSSLEQLDDHPLYTMRYVGPYPEPALAAADDRLADSASLANSRARPLWSCALFAALGDPGRRLYGRNFDWRPSPAVLLFTSPPDGYASASMVDIEYLGYSGSRAENLLNLPLDERKALLEAPALPFDGMNDQGLAIGMAAVSPGGMSRDPNKKTIGQLEVMREILDHARTVDEALNILERYNIDMGSVPLHYLIASSAGNSALAEFYEGKMVVFRNDSPWQLATNFIVASMDGQTAGQCPRYDRLNRRLRETQGKLNPQDALGMLADVSQGGAQAQSNTQWSVVYDMTGGDIHIVMDREYATGVHTLRLAEGGSGEP